MNVRVFGAIIAALAVGGALTIAAPRSADARPEFAAQTGRACGACHQNPAGSGPLKPFGAAFKANGYKLPGKKPK
jgi:mono/diheme cytochrome c family protein